MLANLREWRNSFIYINRIPSEILSLIPTHLSSREDIFRASSVCRHWRGTFIQYAPLWSQLILSKGEPYTKTLLERAKGSALDIITERGDPASVVTLLLPHNQQIKSLEFELGHWEDIQKFSEVNSGPLPLLRTLKINVVNGPDLDNLPNMAPPSLPLFTSAVNLKEFVLHSERFPFLNHFVFPNLTSFELFAIPGVERYHASELLDFLEASPMLRTVRVKIIADLVHEDVPRERVVVLPDTETFSLVVSDGEHGFITAAHISCPSARNTSLAHEKGADVIPQEIFPTSTLWKAIVYQYTSRPVESVELKIGMHRDPVFTFSLVFRSPDTTALQLGFKVSACDEEEGHPVSQYELHDKAFSQTVRTILDHPSVAEIKRLRIQHMISFEPEDDITATSDVGHLFKSLSTLDELVLCGCDLHLYLAPFFNYSVGKHTFVFPAVKELTISHPEEPIDKKDCARAIMELARSQYALGIPFERVTICMDGLFELTANMLRPWVGVVDCRDEVFVEDP